jgi:tRNA pseudouridine38-40 synthase
MANYKFKIEYDGTRYAGWQRLPGKTTIQGKIENVLSLMCDAPVEIVGAGRTDAGVHAKGMIANAHFETDKTTDEILNYLNRYLPEDIAVTQVREASQRFHARYNAIGKTYCYTCYDGVAKPIFDRRYSYALTTFDDPKTASNSLDLDRMREAAALLSGTHDFRNFCVNPGKKKSPVRHIESIRIERDGDYIRFTFHGNGFLQNMVRILVGTLLEVGYGRMPLAQVTEALEREDRQKAGPTAPACGLCLIDVDYD